MHLPGHRELEQGGAAGRGSLGLLVRAGILSLSLAWGWPLVTEVRSTAEAGREATEALEQPDRS